MPHEPDPTECDECGELTIYPTEQDGKQLCPKHVEHGEIQPKKTGLDKALENDGGGDDDESAEQAHPLEHVIASYFQEFSDQLDAKMTGEMADELAERIVEKLKEDDEITSVADCIEDDEDD